MREIEDVVPAFEKLGTWEELKCPGPIYSSCLKVDDIIRGDNGKTKGLSYDPM